MNTHSLPPAVPRTRHSRRLPLILVCVALLPVLLLLAFFLSYRWSNASAIRRLEAKAKKNGEPLSLVELAAMYPPIPDDQNGAVPLLATWAKDDPAFWTAFQNEEPSLPTRKTKKLDPALPFLGSSGEAIRRTEAVDTARLRAAETYLQQRKEHMASVRAALRYPQFRFPVVITNGFAALLPHLAEIKTETLNFSIESLVASEHGDVDAAVDAVENMARTGKTLATEPFLISHLVRISCNNITLSAAERLVSRHRLSDVQLDRLASILAGLQMMDGLRTSLISERVADLSAFNLPLSALTSNSASDEDTAATEKGYRTAMSLFAALGIKDADKRLILETMCTALSSDTPDTPAALDNYEKVFRNASIQAPRFPPKVISMLLLPAMQKVPSRFAAFEGRRRSALVALAVERYRMHHNGNLPQQLADLTPEFLVEIPADPFDGQPLRYKPLQTGFEIYSIGADRRDNDGRERPEKGVTKDFDETFFIER